MSSPFRPNMVRMLLHTRALQVEGARWLVDIRAATLAVLPLSTAGGALRQAAVTPIDMRTILMEGDLIAVGQMLQLRASTATRRV